MNTFRSMLSSRALNRALPWIAGVVLLAGVIAFWQSKTDSKSAETPLSGKPAQQVKNPKTVPLSPEARTVAVKFIRTAVARENLDEAWKISGPQIRAGTTYKQWLTGDIAVVPYPADAVDQVPIKVDWSYANTAGLSIALLPTSGSSEKPQVFLMELKRLGTGADRRWVVDAWVPYAPPAVPDIS